MTLVEGQDITGVELVLARRDQSIAGVAQDPQGRPLEGATVGAEPEQAGRSRRPVWMLIHQESKNLSGADGRFAIPELRRGQYTVWGSHPSYP